MLYFFGKKNRLAYFQEKNGYNAKKTTEKVTQHGLKDSKSCESPMMRW